MRTIWDVAAMNACQCASMRPGISTRPFPSIVRASEPTFAIGVVDMRSMVWPFTRTFEGADRAALLPSKMRTF